MLALAGSCFESTRAAGIAFLSGTVMFEGKPAGGATVTVTGNNTTEVTKTDDRGRFSFGNLSVGHYNVTASAQELSKSAQIELGSSGASLFLELSPKIVGSVIVTQPAPIHGSGTDLTLTAQDLARSPASGNLPSLLLQLPGAARGANGVVHINGDHGDVNYILDGVPIPQELNRIIGTELDPSDVAFMDVLQGAYPAQYGERFASVLNINSNTGLGQRAGAASLGGGSSNNYDLTLGYRTQIGKGWLVVSSRNEQSTRQLDPPNFDSPHDRGSDTNQFVRYTLPIGNDFLNVTSVHSYQTFQIPNDVASGEPASTDDNETQADWFTAVQFRHAIGDHGSLSFGPAYKQSRIRDFGDPQNDLTFSGLSLSDDRTARDYRFNVDYALRSRVHEVRWGTVYDGTIVRKLYAFLLLSAPASVVDNAPNVGHMEEAYLQDSWRMGERWQLDYGVRFDAFQLFSTQFSDGTSQFSPRLKLTRFFGPRTSAYAYFGRFFTPFSFENVSPQAAFLLNLPLQLTPAAFDLKPQRDSVYEIGGHLPLGRGDLGLRIMQKNATDLIDDTQVGVTNLHQDIDYQFGRIATQSMLYRLPFIRRGEAYVSANHTYSVNKGCETQLLAPCFGSPTDWTPADHEQRWGATTGVLLDDPSGGWFAIDGEYGSGLSSAACPPDTIGFCKYTPHVTFDVFKGIALTRNLALTVRVGNIFNDRYLITYFNAQGNHYAAGRTFDLGVRFGPSEQSL